MCYFPKAEGEENAVTYNDYKITLQSKKEKLKGFIVRKMKISEAHKEDKFVVHI